MSTRPVYLRHPAAVVLQAALIDQLVSLPFVKGFAVVYHQLSDWRAKRKHLSMFAPYFSYEVPPSDLSHLPPCSFRCCSPPQVTPSTSSPQVTQHVFGVSRYKVWSAKVHAGTHGAAAKVPPSVTSFRVKPEVAARLNAFANDPSNVQLLATNKGASHQSVALKQVPEKLWKKYEAEVPAELRTSRSNFLEWFNQPVFCLMRGKSCLCGPCTEHGSQVRASHACQCIAAARPISAHLSAQAFEDLSALLEALVVAGLDKKTADGLKRRAEALHNHLAHDYRGLCSLSSTCATRCIPYALSGTGAFGCACEHEHTMSADQENERFYLIDDLRGAIAALRQHVPSGADKEEWEAQLEERGEELCAFERHLGLYQAHLLRKALSASILSTMLDQADSGTVLIIITTVLY